MTIFWRLSCSQPAPAVSLYKRKPHLFLISTSNLFRLMCVMSVTISKKEPQADISSSVAPLAGIKALSDFVNRDGEPMRYR